MTASRGVACCSGGERATARRLLSSIESTIQHRRNSSKIGNRLRLQFARIDNEGEKESEQSPVEDTNSRILFHFENRSSMIPISDTDERDYFSPRGATPHIVASELRRLCRFEIRIASFVSFSNVFSKLVSRQPSPYLLTTMSSTSPTRMITANPTRRQIILAFRLNGSREAKLTSVEESSSDELDERIRGLRSSSSEDSAQQRIPCDSHRSHSWIRIDDIGQRSTVDPDGRCPQDEEHNTDRVDRSAEGTMSIRRVS